MHARQLQHKILWLASYPKSGNTWFRAFLTALMNDGEVEINHMKTDGIFSSRRTFDNVTDLSSRDLYDEEVKLMLADVYRHVAAAKDELSIVKIHDAFVKRPDGQYLVPEDVTHRALYFVRNPLDIAGSLANHMHISIQEAVDVLVDTGGALAPQAGNLNVNAQFRQYMSDWSSHVRSWTLLPSFPVHVIRYEDMLQNGMEIFRNAVEFIGLNYDDSAIAKAMQASSFERLSNQEAEKGFVERARKTSAFFRKGTMRNWEYELTSEQIDRIRTKHKEMMDQYGYQL